MEDKEKIIYLEKSNNKLKREIQELRNKIKKYKYDSLTGLLRREDFCDRLEEFWYNYTEFGHNFILAMVDINGLHALNRDIGFDAGDELIISVANQLKENFSDSVIARYGGDEFLILCKGSNKDDFDKRLEVISDSETYSIFSNETYENIGEIFCAVDDGVTRKKKNKLKCPYEVKDCENCIDKKCLDR